MTLLGVGLVVLASRPLRPWQLGLVAAMAAGYGVIMGLPFMRNFFELDLFTDATAWWISGIVTVTAGCLIAAIPWAMQQSTRRTTSRRHE